MRVLITGSSGRIGQAIAAHLQSAGHDVIGLDQRNGRFTTRLGNINDAASIEAVVPGADTVFHVAALHAPQVGQVRDNKFVEVNVDGTKRLLEACLRHRVRRMVYTSTTSLYGQAMEGDNAAVWVDEALPPQPRDIYDRTKIDAEQLCRQAASHGLSSICLRMSRCFPEALRTIAIYRLYRGVDLRDVVRAHELAMTVPLEGFDILNISARSPFGRGDLEQLHDDAAAVIQRYHPWAEEEFRIRGWELPGSIDRVYVVDRAASILGFEPAFNFASVFGRDK